MALWGAIILLAVAGTTVLADPSLTFPEEARGAASRIVSGWEARPGQFPHQLSIRMVSPAGAVSSCGGTIVHEAWGLTAAHCTASRVTLVIRAGTVNLTQPSAIFETSKYYNHPLYNEALQSIVQPNDIGLIEFGRRLVFSDTIQPIRIQRSEARNENYNGVRSIASGWGRTWTNGASPENLNWVYLRITSNDVCLAAYGGSSIIQDSTICARGYNVTSQSTCQGDSGGPLTIIDIDGAVTQVGVTSFVSASGCHTDFPAGFIRPGFYHDWYTEVTGIDFDWEYSNVTTEYPVNVTTTESPVNITTEGPVNITTTLSPINITTTESTVNLTTTETPENITITEIPVNVTTESPVNITTTESPVNITTSTPVNETTTTTEAPDSSESSSSSDSSSSESDSSDSDSSSDSSDSSSSSDSSDSSSSSDSSDSSSSSSSSSESSESLILMPYADK